MYAFIGFFLSFFSRSVHQNDQLVSRVSRDPSEPQGFNHNFDIRHMYAYMPPFRVLDLDEAYRKLNNFVLIIRVIS